MNAPPDPLPIVPARGGSKRLPGKNLRPLAGSSLLERTRHAIAASGLGRPLLSTDDPAIAEAGRALDYWVPFARPAELARDDTPTLPVVLHALDWCRAALGREPETVALVQATSPFLPPGLLREALARLAASPAASGVIAAARLHVPLGAVYAQERGALAPVLPGDGRVAYVPSGAFYLVRTAALRAHRSFVPPGCLVAEHGGASALDIDTPEDWALAEAIAAAFPAAPQDRTASP